MAAQLSQQKQLIARHEREIKDMNARQARLSVESMREVMNDKTLKSRGIKEGRLREKQQNNTKKFMEERKIAQMVQNREKEKLKDIHEKQLEELHKEMNGVCIVVFHFHKCTIMYWTMHKSCNYLFTDIRHVQKRRT